jgi:hypothetical protein
MENIKSLYDLEVADFKGILLGEVQKARYVLQDVYEDLIDPLSIAVKRRDMESQRLILEMQIERISVLTQLVEDILIRTESKIEAFSPKVDSAGN